jgi:filamentous hemagglutinin family protein
MSIPLYRRHIRRTLAISTVLASGCVPAVGWAQALPRASDVRAVMTSPGGGNPTVTRSGSTLSVDLKATSTVIDWNGFNVPTGATAEFTDGRGAALARNIAVLNRDVSGSTAGTQILGTLKSDTNVAVWVFNPNGILVGSGAKINTGSLVLTTLKPDQANFLAGNDLGGSYGLGKEGGAAGDIRVQSGATITLSSGNRGLIMVAPKITSAGTLSAGNQDVAFVTATDVTLNYAAGSPLSVTLDKGTSVGGTSQLVTGSVSGRNVVFALASKANVTDALLSVDASVTSASNGDNGIVLSAGRSGNGVTVGSTATETGGVVGIGGSGAWRAINDDVTLTANGAVALTGALRSGGDVVVNAGGLASVAGAVTAGNDYRVAGTGVTLGRSTSVVQSAVDVVDITSTNGTLAGGAGLTLRANANGAGNNLMTLSTAGAAGGDIVFAKGSSIEGGPNLDSDVRIGVGVAGNAISLGDMSARGLLGAVGGGAYTNGLSVGGPLDLGDVTTRSALSLSSGGSLTAGVLTSGGAVTLNGTGAMVLAAVDASGDIALNGSGATTVSSGLVSRGASSDIAIARDGAFAVTGAVTAGGTLTIGTTAATAESTAIGGTVGARDISVVTSGAQTYGGAVRATGGLTATAGGAFTSSGAITAANTVTLTGASLGLNAVTSTNGDLALVATSGGIAGIAPVGVRLTAGGALSATAANGAVTVASGTANDGVLRLTGSGGVTAGSLTGSNDVIVDAGGSAAIVSGAVTAGRNYAVNGGSVSLGTTGSGLIGVVTQAARGAVTISGGAGGIIGLDRLTLQSNSDGTGSEALELAIADTTNGAIAFAPGTTLRGGSASQSDVVIRSGVAEGSVALGNVVARNLLGAVGTDTATSGLTRTSALSLGNATLTGPLSLSGAGLATGALTAGGVVTLTSSSTLTTGAISTADAVTAVAAGNLRIASARGVTGVTLTSTGGDVDVAGALSATAGPVTVVANVGAARLLGAVTAGGDYRVSGGSVTLGGVQAAVGAVSIAATAGTLTGASGLSLTSGSDGRTAQSLALSATGGIGFAANSVINGGPAQQGAVTVDGGANAITLGDVNGRSLVFNAGQPLTGALTVGDIAVVDGLSITGGAAGIRLGDVSVSSGGLAITAVDGVVNFGSAALSGDLAVSGSRIDYGTINANAVDLRSVGTSATGIAGGRIDASGPVTITAIDGIGGVATGAITTKSNLTINSVGEIRLASVDAGGTADLATLTNPADVLIVNGLTAVGKVTIASTRDIRAPFITSTGSSLSLSAPNGDVTGYLPGTTIELNTGVDGGYTVDVGRAVRLGALTGGPVSLRADTIEIGSISVGTNLVKLFADSGDLTIRNGIKAGLVDLRASGAVSVGGLIDASDAVTLTSTDGLSFGGIRGLSVAANSGGAITGGAIRSSGAINLTGGSLRVGDLSSATGAITLEAVSGKLVTGDLTAVTKIGALARGDDLSVGAVTVSGGSANLASTAGDARLDSGSASGDIVLSAAGVAASPGAILAGGNYLVTGGTVLLGRNVTQEAGGRIAITATSGNIGAGDRLVLIANSGNGVAGDAMLLDAAGAIDLLGSRISVRNGGALGLRAGSGKTVTLGDIDAGLVGGIATAADGSRSVSTLFANDAAFTAGTIRAANLGIALSAGDLAIDDVTTTQATQLSTAAGAIRVGSITADTFAVDASGLLAGGAYASRGDNSVAAGSIGLTSLTASVGSTSAAARTGDIAIATVAAGITATLTAPGAIGVRSITANALTLDAGGTVTGGTYAIKDATSVAGQSIRLAGLTSETGSITATARRDGIAIDRLAAGGGATLTAPGTIAIGGLTANTLTATAGGALSGGDFTTAGMASLTGQSIALTGITTTQGSLTATATGGDLAISRVTAGGLATLTGTGAVTVNGLTAGALAVDAGGDVSGGTYAVNGAASVVGQAVTLAGLTSDTGDVTATARAGDVAITRLVAGGAATATASGAVAIGEFGAKGAGAITATGGGIRLDTATASALTLKAAGDIGGRTGAGATLASTVGDLTVTGDRAVTLAGATSAGDATIGGTDVRVSGGLSAARALLVQARTALTVGDATAGSTLSLTATNGLTAQALRAGGDTSLKAGAALTTGAIDTGGALSVIGGGDVSLASSRTSGAATIDAVGIATLGQMIAGPSLTIKASDARLSGIQRAAAVGFENRTGDTSALRLGDGTAADGFQLSDAEIKLIEADALTFRQGTGAVEIGTLAFDADAGRRTVDVLGTGRMTIDGVVSGAGAGRMFRFGGTTTSETDTASAIHVAATSTAGGRLLFDTADLDLRGNRIAVGLGAGFLNLLNDDATVTQVVAGLVGNANSALYNANLGGGTYDPSAPTTVSAHSLTVRYGDYALFQNTGVARTNTGIVLGGTPTAPVNPALSLRPTTASNTFAAFGTINGVGATAAALLGPDAVALGNANVSATRINGCVVGSGAGCLTAIVIQPTLQVFSASQADLFGSVADLTVPFDPLVGGSNEELLTGLAALAPKPDTDGCVAGKKESCK